MIIAKKTFKLTYTPYCSLIFSCTSLIGLTCVLARFVSAAFPHFSGPIFPFSVRHAPLGCSFGQAPKLFYKSPNRGIYVRVPGIPGTLSRKKHRGGKNCLKCDQMTFLIRGHALFAPPSCISFYPALCGHPFRTPLPVFFTRPGISPGLGCEMKFAAFGAERKLQRFFKRVACFHLFPLISFPNFHLIFFPFHLCVRENVVAKMC